MNKLFEAAKKARLNSYSPYSNYKVGAAVLMKDGSIFGGCNVENSTYGATVCAERTAILSAIAQGSNEIAEICVVTDATPPWPPCGLCRQTLTEFGDGNVKVHLANLSGVKESLKLKDLMPYAFLPEHLSKKSKKKK
ncbi:MAG: cytidine deaminase [Xanthomonadaceae bacterium]|nr:cytidine deaminase [Xanthomonadaceae bacterium]